MFVVTLIQFELVLPILFPSLGAAEDGQEKEATAVGQGKGEHEYGNALGCTGGRMGVTARVLTAREDGGRCYVQTLIVVEWLTFVPNWMSEVTQTTGAF